MSEVIFTGSFRNTPYDFDEVIKINNKAFDSTKIELGLVAVDESQQKTNMTHIVNVYDLSSVRLNSINDWEIDWGLVNYSNIELTMVAEILDKNGELVFSGEPKTCKYTREITQFKEDSNPFQYLKNDQYYIRIKLINYDENWIEYYPDNNGILVDVNHFERRLKEITVDGNIRYNGEWTKTLLPEKVVGVDPNYLKKLINTVCSPMNNKVFNITNESKDKMKLVSKFDSYAMDGIFGFHDTKIQFTMDDLKELSSDKYKLNTYINGKKVFIDDHKTQQKLDGISRVFLQSSDVQKNYVVELETYRKHAIQSEKILETFTIESEKDAKDLYTNGIIIESNKIGSYFNSDDFTVLVRQKQDKHWKRINPYRTIIEVLNYNSEERYGLKVTVLDSFTAVKGNEIMVITNNIMDSMYYKTEAFNKLSNYYQVPCYFVPIAHITEYGEVITEYMEDIENTEVYVNGYRLIPEVDFSIINLKLHKQVPSIILFKDMTNFNSKIEVVYHDYQKGTYYFINSLKDRTDGRAVYTLPEDNNTPFIEGTFTVYCNNKKLNNLQYDIINSNTIIFKNINSKNNIMIKFHYEDNKHLKRYLELYKLNPPIEDINSIINGNEYEINKFIKTNNIPKVINNDEDYYIGLKYVYQLDESYSYFEYLFKLIKTKVPPRLNANINNFFKDQINNPVTMDYKKELPLYFNHNISINSNRQMNTRRFEDNIALFNPGRTFLIYDYIGKMMKNDEQVRFDSNKLNSVPFTTFLNESIPLIIPYINNNILIDCNEAQDIANYKD